MVDLKIATPVSHLFKSPICISNIIKFSNCLEVREHSKYHNPKLILLFHFDIDINLNWSLKEKIYIINKLNKYPKLKLISFQMSKSYNFVKIKNMKFFPLGQKLSEKQLLNNSKKNISWLKKNLNKDISIAIENNNYYRTGAYEIVTNPKFISKVINNNNVFFLFDLAHAIISSYNMKIDYNHYIQQLPLNKTIQVHICRPGMGKNEMLDKHYLPNKTIFENLKLVKKNSKHLKFVTIEYYKDCKRLINCLKKLKTYINENL